MPTVSRDKLKIRGKKRLINSFKYAFQGIYYAFKYEQNLTVHLIATILAIVLGLKYKITNNEWLIIFLTIGLVVATELINTSIEATIDLITDEINPVAKIAKDTAAAAVLVFGFTAVAVATLIFIPKVFNI